MRFSQGTIAAAALCCMLPAALPAAGPTTAQNAEDRSVLSLAERAMFKHCDRLQGSTAALIKDDAVAQEGYELLQTRDDPRFGRVDIARANASNGSVMFTQSRDAMLCQIGLTGPGARQAFNALRSDPERFDEALEYDPLQSGQREGMRVDTFRTPAVRGTYFVTQFIDPTPGAADAPLMVQTSYVEEK